MVGNNYFPPRSSRYISIANSTKETHQPLWTLELAFCRNFFFFFKNLGSFVLSLPKTVASGQGLLNQAFRLDMEESERQTETQPGWAWASAYRNRIAVVRHRLVRCRAVDKDELHCGSFQTFLWMQ